jgi:homoserine O-acetyltransferase/O-succinyltransferase
MARGVLPGSTREQEGIRTVNGERAPLSNEPLPPSGAWRPDDPIGERRFLSLATDRPFVLEGGGKLRDITLAYQTWGELNAARDNAVLLCHALTGDSHAAGPAGNGHPVPGWWDDLVGSAKAFDTDRFYVVCANVLGGCQGTTGPSSVDAATGRPYGSRFPTVTVRDLVRTQVALADHLGIERWFTVAGGSMGGMQVLEWGVMYPDRVRSLIPMATCAAATAQQIAYSAVERFAIALDPGFNGGDYYGAPPDGGPHRGLALARQIAQITYRTEQEFGSRFDRAVLDNMDDVFRLWQRFQVESYLDYQGAKLVKRFDANSYLVISKAMDLHDVGRGRGGVEAGLARIVAPTLTLSIDSDALYFPYQQEFIRDTLHRGGTPVEHVEITSLYGHDAFLLESRQVAEGVTDFLLDVEKHHD